MNLSSLISHLHIIAVTLLSEVNNQLLEFEGRTMWILVTQWYFLYENTTTQLNTHQMNLLNIDGGAKELCVPVLIASPTKSSSASPYSSPKDKISLCLKVFRILRRSTVLKILLPIAFLILIIMLISAFKSTTRDLLTWIETQNLWMTFFIFLLLFTLVSFPLAVGYLVLIISCGYMFSMWRGLVVAMIGANVGVAIAHYTMRSLHKYLPIHRWVNDESEYDTLMKWARDNQVCVQWDSVREFSREFPEFTYVSTLHTAFKVRITNSKFETPNSTLNFK